MKRMKWLPFMLAMGCMGRDESRASKSGMLETESAALQAQRGGLLPMTDTRSDDSGGAGAAFALEEGKMGKKESERADGQYKMRKETAEPQLTRNQAIEHAKTAGVLGSTINGKGALDSKNDEAGVEAVTRAWFPETFLFEPLVVTDDKGEATVPVHVPDRLTTWRVLALAHSRTGAQAGATTSFLGTLPSYVDPVVPPFLIAGDKIKLPVQMINTTDAAIASTLTYQIEGGKLAGGGGPKTIPAQGSLVDYATLTAERAGTIKLRVGLGATDAVARTIDVIPSGKPVTVTRAGTLAAPRELSIEGPAGSDPSTDRVRLMVYPGALALLRSELAVSTARSGVAEDSYALLLAGNGARLLAQLGDKADPQVLRELSLVTAQRAIRHGRTLDHTRATLIAEAALAHLDNPVLARLGERAVEYLARNQRPDGTFSGATGWTLQRVLVATSDGTRAASSNLSTAPARQRAAAVRAKAATAFARHFEQVTDAYTAAAVLASGALAHDRSLADKYRKRVLDGIKTSEDGGTYLDVTGKVVRADGTTPSRVEATALAVLALAAVKGSGPSPDRGSGPSPDNGSGPGPDKGSGPSPDYGSGPSPDYGSGPSPDKGSGPSPDNGSGPSPDYAAQLADLGTTLLGSYVPAYGWGDGVTNLACMRAILELFKTPLPTAIKISLSMDGRVISSGQFDAAQLKDVLVLGGPGNGFAGKHTWSIVAEPSVPGLGYSLALDGYVPWTQQTVQKGLELQVPPKLVGKVGRPLEVPLTAIAPSSAMVHIRHALPAGVQPDRPSLEALVSSGQLSRFEIADSKIDLYVNPLQPGQVFTAKYKVIPTLAGTLHAAASLIETGATTFHVPPSEWMIE